MSDHSNKRKGTTLENIREHQQDHFSWSRRNFLGTLGMAGSVSMVLGKIPLAANLLSPFQNMLSSCQNDRSLVLIRLKGGNDGLNTILPLPYYDYYRNVRPTLGLLQNEISNLTDQIAIPNFMDDLLPMWNEGDFAIVNSVGYDDQNLSHFRSSDIWASGSEPDENLGTGWLGRYFSSINPDYLTNAPEIPLAIQIGGFGNLLFNGTFDDGSTNLAMTVTDPEQLYNIAQTGQLYDAIDLPDECQYGSQIGYMRSVANNVLNYAGKIKDAYDQSANNPTEEYQDDELGRQLALVSRLIKGNLGTKVYMVSIDGFDTHAEQKEDHQRLLSSVSTNIRKFYDDLKMNGMDKNVLSMTFSEFGRRIEENGSFGTDHGASAPVMFFGGELGSNHVIGNVPNLQQPDIYGNLRHQYDFRQLYATVLENWLEVDPMLVDDVLGQSYERIEDLIYKCGLNTATTDIIRNRVEHHVRYGTDGYTQIYYVLKSRTHVKVDLFDVTGKFVSRLYDGEAGDGEHFIPIQGISKDLPAAQYIYRIETSKFGTFSGKLNRLF